MTHLYVKAFSCIEEADFNFAKIAVLIGPQASGKSIISKLVYFFYEILSLQLQAIEDAKSLDAFKSDISDEFCKWFPPSAWGRRKFIIRFEAGPYTVALNRSAAKRALAKSRVLIKFSSYFEQEYSRLLKVANSKQRSKDTADVDFGRDIDLFWRIRNAAERQLKKDMGPEFCESQLFVPAGRSFFTSLGKAIAAFEGGILDPVTVRFGKSYASIRERGWRYDLRFGQKAPHRFSYLAEKFFGGRLRNDREQEYLELSDGRKIPFAMLSSGQQELLPLLLAVDRVRFRERDLLYIEEPEAHLFPTTQSDLIDYLVRVLSFHKSKRMLITTHSPYVLSKINVLAKAGVLSKRRPKSNSQIEKILPKALWLKPNSLTAYAMIDGRLVSILGKDGLLDGDYLDDISGALSREFSSLLEIENQG